MLLAVHYRVMEHLGSLESTQEATVAIGYHLGQFLRFFRALQTSRVLQFHKLILKFSIVMYYCIPRIQSDQMNKVFNNYCFYVLKSQNLF